MIASGIVVESRYLKVMIRSQPELDASQDDISKLTDHLFRHEAGKMVAVLTRIFGLHNLDLAEDVVQEAFGKAITEWRFHVPQNPPHGSCLQRRIRRSTPYEDSDITGNLRKRQRRC